MNFSLQDYQNSCNMILYGSEREIPIHVNSMLFECLSKVILEAPIENEDAMKTENATPIKVRSRMEKLPITWNRNYKLITPKFAGY